MVSFIFLFRRAKKEQERAEKIKEVLASVTERRLFATLQSSSFALSSDEAKRVWGRLNVTNATLGGLPRFRNSIEQNIQALEDAEMTFSEKLEQYEQTDLEWTGLLQEQAGARDSLLTRKKEEIEARRALEHAQRKVAEAKVHLVRTSNTLRGVEQRVRKNAQEMERVTAALSTKQDQVRGALRKKAEVANGGIVLEYLSEDDLKALRRKEAQLMGESSQVSRMVARLQSRSEKLKIRATALEKYQKKS